MNYTGSLEVVESLLTRSRTANPAPLDRSGFDSEFEVHVVFTNRHGTQAALRVASQWGRRLRTRIVLWFPLVVPHQIPTMTPAVSTEFIEQRLHALAVSCCEEGLEIVIKVCLCRDQKHCLVNVLEPKTVVLVGGRKRWLPTQEQVLADFLHSCGLRVLFIPSKENVSATLPSSSRLTT